MTSHGAWRKVVTAERPTLLITDDEPSWRTVLQEFLEGAGYQTLLAGSGEEALDVIEERSVDCMLLDHELPGVSGIETLKLIREVRAFLPCIMITSVDSRQLMQQALALHVFTILSKPVSRELVTVSVRRALRRRGPDSQPIF